MENIRDEDKEARDRLLAQKADEVAQAEAAEDGATVRDVTAEEIAAFRKHIFRGSDD